MSGNDLRLSNPGGTSIYDSLTLKPASNTQEKPPAQTPAKLEANDNTAIQEQKESNAVKSVNFVEGFAPPPNSAPLINPETNEPYLFKTDDKGIPLMNENGEFLVDEENGLPGFVKVNENGEAIGDENGNMIFVETIGNVPAKAVNFGDSGGELPPLMELDGNKKTEGQPEGNKPEIITVPLSNLETGQPVKLKVDDKGYPLQDESGQFIPDENEGKLVWVQVDKNSGEPLTKEGKLVLGSPPPEVAFQEGMTTVLSTHAAQRVLQGTMNIKFAQWGVAKLSTGLVSGVSMAIPLTNKAVGFGVKHAVAKAVTEELAKVTVAKTGSTTVVSAMKGAVKPVTEAATKALTEAGKLGQGIETLAMKGAAKTAGGRVNAAKIAYDGVKATAREVADDGLKAAGNVVKKVVVGGSEKVLKEGVEKGIEKGINIAIKRGGAEIAETIATKGTEKAIVKAAETASVKIATKGAAKVGARLGAAIPVIGAVGGAAITVWDVKDAYEKTRDPKASTASAALAWTTVGLDVISTAAVGTGIGAPIGWIASGLSIGTSVLSDYLR